MKEQFCDYMDLRREVCTVFQLNESAPGIHVEYFDTDFEGTLFLLVGHLSSYSQPERRVVRS
jgi:hypothetical protein